MNIEGLKVAMQALKMLKGELEEEFYNCKDQWHDPSTGHILVENMKAFECVQEEINRKITQLEELN